MSCFLYLLAFADSARELPEKQLAVCCLLDMGQIGRQLWRYEVVERHESIADSHLRLFDRIALVAVGGGVYRH